MDLVKEREKLVMLANQYNQGVQDFFKEYFEVLKSKAIEILPEVLQVFNFSDEKLFEVKDGKVEFSEIMNFVNEIFKVYNEEDTVELNEDEIKITDVVNFITILSEIINGTSEHDYSCTGINELLLLEWHEFDSLLCNYHFNKTILDMLDIEIVEQVN